MRSWSLDTKQVVGSINSLPCMQSEVIIEMESGYFLPSLGCYWECMERCSLWIGLIAVFVTSSIREHFISTHIIVMH